MQQATNRLLTNEKNRYYTIFQSMAEPAFVVGPDRKFLILKKRRLKVEDVSGLKSKVQSLKSQVQSSNSRT